jgi:nucleotide-binding universal stress UspA family protein
MLPIRTILHPTDFSPLARQALDVAAALAHDYQARLIVLYVHEPPLQMGELVATEPPDYRASLMRDLQAQRPVTPVEVEHRLEEGPVADAIVRAAEQTQADLIVLGTHGRSGLGRVLLGSVAEQVLRKAPCLVLTVKPGAVQP